MGIKTKFIFLQINLLVREPPNLKNIRLLNRKKVSEGSKSPAKMNETTIQDR